MAKSTKALLMGRIQMCKTNPSIAHIGLATHGRSIQIGSSHPKLEKIAGDALEMATVKRALTGIDVVIQQIKRLIPASSIAVTSTWVAFEKSFVGSKMISGPAETPSDW
jgi:hypothetical protein